jgi:hypothetical protein
MKDWQERALAREYPQAMREIERAIERIVRQNHTISNLMTTPVGVHEIKQMLMEKWGDSDE